jgi:archaemetzincin
LIVKAALTAICIMSALTACNPLENSERVKAIGNTKDLPARLQRAFHPGTGFAPLEAPRPGDWLAEHKEPGQTYAEFASGGFNRPDRLRSKIYLQPLGDFSTAKGPSLEILREFTRLYFSMEVAVLPPIPLKDGFSPRINQLSGKRQICSLDILKFLRTRLPPDAFCILGVTMEDLYPEPSWNFVFGQASLTERTGVYSFARYDPAFYGEQRDAGYQKVLLKRSLKVIAHETGHMFGLYHCIYYQCVMNGSNHLKESDSRPLHLCPVCLRKLQLSVGFDLVKRYEGLGRFYGKHGYDGEAEWVAMRYRYITAVP